MGSKQEKLENSHCNFFEHQVRSSLTQKRKLGKFVSELILHYKNRSSNISYTFVDDETLYDMNVAHLNHDTYTDIITFDLSSKENNFILADIYISVDRVKENAETLGIKYKDELLRVILHGALHLSGFGDKSKKEKEEMRSLEELWMKKYLLLA